MEQARNHTVLALIWDTDEVLETLAAQIAQGAKEAGISEVACLDMGTAGKEAAAALIQRSDGVLFGVTGASIPLRELIVSAQTEWGKCGSVFYTVRAAREADRLRELLKWQGYALELQSYFTGWSPDENDLQNAKNFGFAIGCGLLHIPNPRQPKLVKCLVCGEVFDASLGICPVCGVGLDQCVPVEEDEVSYRRDSQSRYVIIGGGIAAVSAADAIRKRDKTGGIALYSAEPELPIRRPMLTKDFGEALGDLSIHDGAWYAQRSIEVHLDCPITAVDGKKKTVTTAAGQTVPYDKLIFATGGECFVPPFGGCNLTGVLTIRHQQDVKTLAAMLKGVTDAVVIGGGVLGMEAASELHRLGLHLTILEAAPQILGRQVDAVTANAFRAHLNSMGVACYEGVQIAAAEGTTGVTGVRLADGRVFPAQLVIVSCGNRANAALAKQAGALVDRAIVVNQRMQTNVPEVYACGDCAQWENVNVQLWQEAELQGKTAGANAAGERMLYQPPLFGLSMEAFGTSLFTIGDLGKQDKPYRLVETVDGVRHCRERYWFVGEGLQGAALLGRENKIPQVSTAVAQQQRYETIFGGGN